jgi:hypothetical protein
LNVWGFRVRVLEIEFERGVLWEWKDYYCWVDLIGFVRCVLHILGLKSIFVSINLTRIPDILNIPSCYLECECLNRKKLKKKEFVFENANNELSSLSRMWTI